MPAATASRRMEYSAAEIDGKVALPACRGGMGWGGAVLSGRLVRGKLSHRLRDLLRVRHEELLLRGVERHGRDVRRRHADDRAVQVAKSVLRDDRHNFGAE